MTDAGHCVRQLGGTGLDLVEAVDRAVSDLFAARASAPGVPPAPEGTVGLRHFTVVLEDDAELDALRRRARAAGVEVEDTVEGSLLRDPSGNALLFRPA